MKTSIVGLTLVLTAAAAPVPAGQPPAAAPAPVTIEIDAGKRHQTIDGFGGTVGWIYPAKEKEAEVADLLFKDLGASILRLSALTRYGDPTDEGTPEPANDNADPSVIDWKRFDFANCEAKQAAFARAAAERGVKTVVAASWSPPGWMKASGTRLWGGELRPGMEKELAELWTAYLLWMKMKDGGGGAAVGLVALQNEPEVSWSYPTAYFSPEGLDRAARALLDRAAKEKEAPKFKLLHPEVSQLGRIKPYIEATSRETWAGTAAVSVHAYDLTVDYHDIAAYRKLWRDTREILHKPGKPVWMTEFSNSTGAFSGKDQGSWAEALAWVRHIHLALVDGDCSAALFWGLYFDKKGEALLYAEKSDAQTYEITPKFYTSKNFYRFVRPGAVRVDSAPAEGPLETSAFWHAEKKELVAVVINPGDAAVLANFRVKGLDKLKRVEMHRTSREEKCVKLDEAAARAGGNIQFPAQSVTTVVFDFSPSGPATPRASDPAF